MGEFSWVSAKDLKPTTIIESIDHLTQKGISAANIAPKGSLLILLRGMTLHSHAGLGRKKAQIGNDPDLGFDRSSRPQFSGLSVQGLFTIPPNRSEKGHSSPLE